MLRKMNRYPGKGWLPLGLCFLISFNGFPPAAFAQSVPARIDIIVVAGEGASSPARQPVTQNPAVRVEDDDHHPLERVSVVFAVPVSGTSGEFTNGTKTLAVMTDKTGVATAHGLRTNQVPGKLQIYVTASFHGLRARTVINQIVEGAPGSQSQIQRPSKSGGSLKWVVLGIVAAGAAGAGVYLATRNSSSSSSNPPVTIGTGPVVFGSPQ
jgi:hypothetical protein